MAVGHWPRKGPGRSRNGRKPGGGHWLGCEAPEEAGQARSVPE